MGDIGCSDCGVEPSAYHHAPGCPRYGTAPSDMAPMRAYHAQQNHRTRLGEITRLAFAGAWRADVEAFEMHSDLERLPEVDRLLGRCVRLAAQGHGRATSDAIDAARSAAAACPEVPALAKDVERIIAILEAS